ncbi:MULTISPECIES: DUF1120 domain-containing protein [unclassified Pseudomonas]|uniref:DUF1120 domain-containing protein n=1 Tax=unclassified Pseudomonas TaxID=196821 RepID=UPI002AC977FD|nr:MULTISPECIES: DUF1120 domain-containing protein [unclassified Pseudomonas]MEB0044372.1 DUF1120 domain-containing protein [Pseudomonas sp. Dout3]MEB0094691.1 DUF1120 domain-containing protein [Pseudomonas sp. DC1.2]WPX59941.1 DUF1120 domain-containing protein [Pseudomonas sp. DC1.2]
MNTFNCRFLAALLVAPSVLAASTADLAIKGAITPNACIPALSDGGVIDYGKLSAKALTSDVYTSLPQQSLQLSVRCEGPTAFTLNTLDNRAGSSALYDHWHGLGMTPNNEKLGSTGLGLYNPVADGVSVRTISSVDGGTTWQPSVFLGHSALTAISAAAPPLTPIAVTNFDAELRFYTHIAPTNDLTLIDEVPLDGEATLQLTYL